jgi:hypothetical protein
MLSLSVGTGSYEQEQTIGEIDLCGEYYCAYVAVPMFVEQILVVLADGSTN